MTPLVLLCTVDSEETGDIISRHLVDNRLAACVNMIPSVKSTYRWKDAVETGNELLLVIKSREGLLPALEKAIIDLHPYELPEIVALPIIHGYNPYMEWLGNSLKD